MTKNILSLMLILVLVALSPMTLLAETMPIEKTEASPWTKINDSYVEKSAHKLGFGLLNFTMGWTSIPFETHRYDNKFTGFIKGTWRSITNTLGGALHIVTFPIPVDIPLPDGGVNFE